MAAAARQSVKTSSANCASWAGVLCAPVTKLMTVTKSSMTAKRQTSMMQPARALARTAADLFAPCSSTWTMELNVYLRRCTVKSRIAPASGENTIDTYFCIPKM